MKDSKGYAQRWLKQAEHDLEVAEGNFKNRFFSDTCFMAEQASQKALKAYLFSKGRRFVPEHSVSKLAEESANINGVFKEIIEPAKILDKYYIPTRYPDAVASPAVPFEIYTRREAEESLNYARQILNLVKEKAK